MLSVDTPRVQASNDGVHLNGHTSDERGVALTVNRRRVRGATLLELPPGTVHVRCRDGDGSSMESSFVVVEAD